MTSGNAEMCCQTVIIGEMGPLSSPIREGSLAVMPQQHPPWQQLTAARVLKNISISELARRAEMSRSYLGRLESGERWPSPLILHRLATALDVPLQMIERSMIEYVA